MKELGGPRQDHPENGYLSTYVDGKVFAFLASLIQPTSWSPGMHRKLKFSVLEVAKYQWVSHEEEIVSNEYHIRNVSVYCGKIYLFWQIRRRYEIQYCYLIQRTTI